MGSEQRRSLRMARCALLLALVAAAAALPGNYAPAATTFTEESSGALDRVIEEPASEVLPAPVSKDARAPTDQFKDDPLATTTSMSEDFMNAFKSLAMKTKKFFSSEDAAPAGEVMPPVIELDEKPLKFKTPSLPISKGFEHVLDDTAKVVSNEAVVPPVGSTQKAAEHAGKTIAAVAEKKS